MVNYKLVKLVICKHLNLHKFNLIKSEIINISSSNLDSSLCFLHPVFLMMYSAQKLNKQGEKVHEDVIGKRLLWP